MFQKHRERKGGIAREDPIEECLVGKGRGALPATFAAVLSDQVKQVPLKNAMESFHQLAVTEDFDWPLSALLPNVLQQFDLNDCYRTLESKKLKQIDIRGPHENG